MAGGGELMPNRREDAHAAEDDDGCLRRVMAVPSGSLSCYSAWTIRPSGTWGEDAYGAIGLVVVDPTPVGHRSGASVTIR